MALNLSQIFTSSVQAAAHLLFQSGMSQGANVCLLIICPNPGEKSGYPKGSQTESLACDLSRHSKQGAIRSVTDICSISNSYAFLTRKNIYVYVYIFHKHLQKSAQAITSLSWVYSSFIYLFIFDRFKDVKSSVLFPTLSSSPAVHSMLLPLLLKRSRNLTVISRSPGTNGRLSTVCNPMLADLKWRLVFHFTGNIFVSSFKEKNHCFIPCKVFDPRRTTLELHLPFRMFLCSLFCLVGCYV